MLTWLARKIYQHRHREEIRAKEAQDQYILYLAEQLENREKRLASIIEHQQDMVCRYEPDTTLTFVNDAYCKEFGRKESDLIGTRFIDLIPDEDRQTVCEKVKSMTVERPVVRYTHRVHTAQGSRWHEWIDSAIIQHGEIIEYQAVGRDVTDQHKLHQKLIEQRDLLDSILETQSDCIVRCTLDRVIVYANRAYSEMFCGVYDYKECLALDWMAHVYEADRDYVNNLMLRFVARPPYRHDATYRCIGADGVVRLFCWQAYGITDLKDNLIEIQGVGREIQAEGCKL